MSLSNFDYILVGAGVAGCTLAAEITKRGLGTVLLLEAGGLPTSVHLKLPSQYPFAFEGRHSWGNSSIAQPRLANRRIALPVGRTLGGSSAINAMILIRGHASDFQKWHSKLGEDWSPDAVSEAFRAIEKSIGILDQAFPPLHNVIADFLQHVGSSVPKHQRLEEPKIGVGPFVRCQRNGRRQSAWDLRLKHQASNPSVTVRTDTTVDRVLFDLDRAIGVQVLTPNGTESILASKGVLLCAGAIHSPRLLIASGLGDAAEVGAIGLDLICKSPAVGKNLHDHLVYPIVHKLRRGTSLNPSPSVADRIQYVRDRTGPRSSNIAEAGGFFAWRDSLNPSVPDYQWHITPTHYLEYPYRVDKTSAISIGVTVLQPKSRGSIRLVSNRTTTGIAKTGSYELQIDPAYVTDESDLSDHVRAIQESRSLLAEKDMGSVMGQEIMPGESRTDEVQIARSIVRFATTIYHYVGSCRMGKSMDDSVVDSRFRVHGVEGFWVCDASAMPTIVSANPQATVMMMAHRLANWL